MHANNSKEKSLHHHLARAVRWHRQGELKKAESAYRKILRQNPDHADALNLLGLIAYQRKDFENAERLINQAIELNNSNSDYHNNLGTVLKALGRLAEAHKAYLRALDLKPDCANTAYNMGGLCLVNGDTDQAIHYYRKTIAVAPGFHQAYTNLSAIYNERKEYQNAVDCCRQGIQSGAGDAALYNNLGNALKGIGQYDQAVAIFEKTIQLNPSSTEAHSNLGNTLRDLGRSREAIAAYQKALQADPDNGEAHNNLGTVLRELGRFKEAMACYQTAMRLAPQDAVPYHNMGNIFMDQGKNEEALKCFEKALSMDPKLIEAYVSLGIVLQDLGKGTDAESCFKKAISLRPDYPKPYCHLIRTFQHECNWEGLKKYSPVLDDLTQKALDNGRKPDEVPFLHLSRHCDPGKNYQVAKSWSDHLIKHVNHEGKRLHHRLSDRENGNGKITVGYLSNNFKNHPTAHLVGGMFRHHRRERFDIYCYSYGINDQSAYRRQIENECDRFMDIASADHIEAARQISRDKVDILVDLVGQMKSSRLEIAAMRPAPIQVRWLGMAGTTGADFFDYIITDRIVTPEDQAEHYSETFCYMPQTYQINNRHQMIAEMNWQKKDAGLPENGFIYCSFCSTYKIDPVIFKAWMTILGRVPESVLWLLAPSPGAQNRLKGEAQRYDIDPNRLVFADKMDRAAHLARLPLADLSLDTMIVNGAATTSEALWCGVPVLTIKGRHFASRMASSILAAINLPELITASTQDYTRLAVRLARDQAFFHSIKARLAIMKNESMLFDTAGFVRNLEDLYRQMWDIYTSGEERRVLKVMNVEHRRANFKVRK